jgi:Rrf2 family protein
MSTLFSRQCEYALQSVMYLALKKNGHATSARELTEHLDIPYHFLAKILQKLTQVGVLSSRKGPGGGFTLGNQAEEITLLAVIEAIDGTGFEVNCVLGFEECSRTRPCALHDQWSQSRELIKAMLAGNTVAQMAGRMQKPQYRKAIALGRIPA